MVEEVNDELWNDLVEFNLTKLPELDLLADVRLLLILSDAKYLFVLLFLFLQLLEKFVLVAENFNLLGHFSDQVQHLSIRVVSILCQQEIVLEVLHPLVHDYAHFSLTLLDLFGFRPGISIIVLIILFFGWHSDAASLLLELAEVFLVHARAS